METRIEVNWVNKKADQLPAGLKYITVAKFASETWEKEAWSVVLEFSIPPNIQGNPSKGMARFLSEKAPLEKFVSGSTFEMYEGRNKTAEVKVL